MTVPEKDQANVAMGRTVQAVQVDSNRQRHVGQVVARMAGSPPRRCIAKMRAPLSAEPHAAPNPWCRDQVQIFRPACVIFRITHLDHINTDVFAGQERQVARR